MCSSIHIYSFTWMTPNFPSVQFQTRRCYIKAVNYVYSSQSLSGGFLRINRRGWRNVYHRRPLLISTRLIRRHSHKLLQDAGKKLAAAKKNRKHISRNPNVLLVITKFSFPPFLIINFFFYTARFKTYEKCIWCMKRPA